MGHTDQLLRRLISRRAPAIVDVRAGGGNVALQVVLLKEGDREGDRGVWAELAAGVNLAIDRLIESATPVLVKAEDGPRELSFVSSLLGRHKPLLGGHRVLLAWPASIKTQERRRSDREPIPESAPISAILLKDAGGLFPPANVAVKPLDLSVHGACLICPGVTSAPPKRGRDLQLQLKLAGVDHRIAAQYRSVETLPTGHLRLRIEFSEASMPAGTAAVLAELLQDLRSRRVLRELNGAITGRAR